MYILYIHTFIHIKNLLIYFRCQFHSKFKEYLLRLQRGIIKKHTWRILRRYNDFAELHKYLSISGLELPLPGKRLFGNMRPDFIAERRQALQVYINTVLMNPILASSLPAKRFVDRSKMYITYGYLEITTMVKCIIIVHRISLSKTILI